ATHQALVEGTDGGQYAGRGYFARLKSLHRFTQRFLALEREYRVFVGGEDGEHHSTALGGHRHGRGKLRDPAHTGCELGHTVRLSVVQIEAVHVLEAVLVADEIQTASIGRKLRVVVESAIKGLEVLDLRGLQIEDAKPRIRVSERLEICPVRAAVGHKGEVSTIRRPRRL